MMKKIRTASVPASSIYNFEIIKNLLEDNGFTTTMPVVGYTNRIYITGVQINKGDRKKSHVVYNKMIEGVDETLVSPRFFRMFVEFEKPIIPQKVSTVFQDCTFLVDLSIEGEKENAQDAAKKVLFNIINILEKNDKAISRHGGKIPSSYSEIKILT